MKIQLKTNMEIMDFGGAIKALKEGKKVARKSWNGEKWLWLVETEFRHNEEFKDITKNNYDSNKFSGTICMKFNDINILWSACHFDILSDDWMIVD